MNFDPWGKEEAAGETVLDDVYEWLTTYICTMRDDDHRLLTLWAAHTHLAHETYTTPRLIIDSPVPEAGKTTTLDHLERLCVNPILAASLSSAALLVRAIQAGQTTVLIDEADRSLDPNNDKTGDLISIVNSGYRRGSTRPVLVPGKGGEWRVEKMPTYAPVAMAGNDPQLPADTRSRAIRVLLFPDVDETVSESDWELIGDDATALGERLALWADTVRDNLRTGTRPPLPAGVKARGRERWLPLKRVAVAYGGEWPEIVDRLAKADVEQLAADKEDGYVNEKPAVTLLRHLHDMWPGDERFVATKDLVAGLILGHPRTWSEASPYGKDLTSQRMGRMLVRTFGVNSSRPHGPRGYTRASLEPAWKRMRIDQPPAPTT